MGQYCFLFLVVYSLISSCLGNDTENKRQVYIVYMGNLPTQVQSASQLQEQHQKMVRDVVATSFHDKALITSYKRSFNGFAAYLTEQEKHKLESHQGVVSIFPSKTRQLLTTRSWDYMGLTESMVKDPQKGSNIIIGVLDSGIWPESESFNDTCFGPIPKKWKGVCKGGQNFTCNKKLIGARYYNQAFIIGNGNSVFYEDNTSRDHEGHGTHTASSAAGNLVKGASFYGIAQGTARGGLPSARIAAYKVCSSRCFDAVILSAFDDAIADGVDFITISVGSDVSLDMKQDSIAIGALHAMQRGILTMQAAGNGGNDFGQSINGVAPWVVSVAASTIDRGIVTKVTLGNGKTIVGKSVNSFKLNGTTFPVLYGQGAGTHCEPDHVKSCHFECLNRTVVKGKIVLCDDGPGVLEGKSAGALGVIMKDDDFSDISFTYNLPVAMINPKDFSSIVAYITSTKDANASILPSESMKNVDAPKIASFSSTGPNRIIPNILKPDITAPGVEILAAYSPEGMVSHYPGDERSVKYQILSGTSMACPHVAGAAAYVKADHPDWSISAIKSALMTTAWPMDHTKGNEFSFGVGHLNPVNATNPGLVYEIDMDDYIKLLCKLKYSDADLHKLFKNNTIVCPKIKQQEGNTILDDFNYPSMAIKGNEKTSVSVRFTRTVKNVGYPNSTYKAKIDAPKGVQVIVEPQTLSFQKSNEKKTFSVDVKANEEQPMVSASLVWSDGVHLVHSPIVVYWKE